MKLAQLLYLPLLLSLVPVQAGPLPDYAGGRYVDNHGHKFFLDCYGSGTPTVLLSSGQGGGFLDWLLVQPEIAKTHRVCSFDPPGYGRSEATPDADTFEGNVGALTAALRNTGERGPFVVVGQSYGGIDARLFQYHHPELVTGMVLVDSYEIGAPWKGQMVPLYELSAEQLRSTLPDHSHAPKPTPPSEIEPPFRKLPAAAQQEHLDDVRRMIAALDFSREPSIMESFRSTMVSLHSASTQPDSLHGMPLMVITRDGSLSPPEEQIQESYLKLSSRSQREIAKGSGHFVQLDDPGLVIAAINQVASQSHSH